jgi:hypothetical protein
LAHNVQFYTPPPHFFRLTPGLFVEFPVEGDAARQGQILEVLEGSARVMDERGGKVVGVFYTHATRDKLTTASLMSTRATSRYRAFKLLPCLGPRTVPFGKVSE